jgi:hypothetical protein
MAFMFLILQIGDLFNGNFNWRGVFHLFLFIVMGLIVVGFSGFIITKAFKSPKK